MIDPVHHVPRALLCVGLDLSLLAHFRVWMCGGNKKDKCVRLASLGGGTGGNKKVEYVVFKYFK